ncbi:hypothetical protein, partial [Mesorhizobium sp. M2D.F.Ca.ET.223.01.1.1]|uniref:hypothetical protein n=1 Tax=Mesorhizobium sp. M2D.F.Ca.ET.223.01.1.1 TaxID=2563940 RepID=UPI001AEDC605
FRPPSATTFETSTPSLSSRGKASIRSGVSRAAQRPQQMRAYKAQTMKCPPDGQCHFVVEPVRDAETGSTGRPKERQNSAA